jgi:hypothetical protein
MANITDLGITTTTAAQFIPQVWSTGVVQAAQFGAVIQKRVNTDFKDDLAVGNTLNIPRLSNLNTQSKSAGLANGINFEAPTETGQQITVSTHEYAAFIVESVVQVQANQDLRQRYEKKLGYALARGRDVTLAALFNGLSTNSVGTLGVELASDDYLTAWQKLAEAGLFEGATDPGEDFSIILSPAAYAAALKVDIFTNKLYNSDGDAIQKAHVGDIYGMPVYLSNLLNAPSAGQHRCVAMHRECFALIVQEEVPVQSQFMIRYLADGVVAWNLYGTATVTFPPETPPANASPEIYTAVDNRGVKLLTV